MTTGLMGAVISPADLAYALGQAHPPTDEQAAVIAAPVGATLVVAGAGAGKTETMAARVVWMVANGFVDPDQVLGLTFTRKAAQQLTSRIRKRLARLAVSDVIREIDPSLALRDRILGTEAEVSTYHSYAGKLLTEHGLLLPIEPSARLLSETELWQLAHRVVSGWDGVLDTERNPTSITEAILALSGQLAEHLVSATELRTAHDELEALVHGLPSGPGQRGAPTKTLLDILDAQHARVALLPLVEKLSETLTREGALDFGSQMSLSARVAASHPEVGTSERTRFRLVLLDEYQDTGHAQRVLLSSLFGGGQDAGLALTAVGDPMQAIYGWRGASAANLPRFVTDFPGPRGEPARRLELSTSWRNPPEALDVANHVSASLRGRGVPVEMLHARPAATAGDVRIALCDDVRLEREWVARKLSNEYAKAREEDRDPPTAAVLIRRNADAGPLAEALRAHGLPVEIVGLGGLLHTPEVADIIAMVRLVADPLAGSAAVRALTGARWQMGAADLRSLWRRAADLEIKSGFGAVGAVTDVDALEDALDKSVPGEQAERAGLADALADPGPPDHYSPDGYARITALAGELHGLRGRLGQPLPELFADVERSMGIAVEAGARSSDATAVGRAHLDQFAHVVADYSDNPAATLTGFLAFLAAAETVENGLAPGEVEVAEHRVQILTVHSAKGLEWEVVAVPHVVKGVFPSTTASATWLGALAELPPQLRGDRAHDAEDLDGISPLDLDNIYNRKDLEDAITRHKGALAGRKLDEDRRLFYVAVTRTERALYVSGYHWDKSGTKPRGPSPFLAELHTLAEGGAPVRIEEWAAAPSDVDQNPVNADDAVAVWPRDPLGDRRTSVEAGAELVMSALASDTTASFSDEPESWAHEIDLLLAERHVRSIHHTEVALPANLSVSQLVDLVADPDALAAKLRRPLPYPPNPLARRGTAFHAWIERRFGATRLLDLDELPGAGDTGAAADRDLSTLQDAFERSEWAHRSPIEVEVPFETSVAGTVLRGRIDAVFADRDGGWTVIDWKTGSEPTAAEEHAVTMQLAAYRLAWAELVSTTESPAAEPSALNKVRAAFHYVKTGRTISPADLPGRADLAALLRGEPLRGVLPSAAHDHDNAIE